MLAVPTQLQFQCSRGKGLAICDGRIPLVKYLLKNGANPYLNLKGGRWNAVECAVQWGSCESLDILIAHGPDDKLKNSGALWIAVSIGSMPKIDKLVGANLDINAIPKKGESEFFFFGEVGSEKYLGTALHGAAAHNHIACIKHLLKIGARKDLENDAGCTPRAVAERFGYNEAAHLLH
jgi:ankyrin repeat protein